jgi:DNA-directed RNA polymerase subunit H (RpoH/RPB5)
MEVIGQIVKSRKILKEVLKDEYDTDDLPIYSIEEMDRLFELETTKENPFKNFGKGNSGKGNACNFTLKHNKIKNHNLHIIYYNIQKDNKTKTMRNIIDRIEKLYDDEIVKNTDNIILILNEQIKDTIIDICNELNIILNKKYDTHLENDIGYTKKHFRNIFMFDIKTLQYNILKHNTVPEHIIYKNQSDIDEICNLCNCTIVQLPIISKYDPVAKLKMGISGDVFKIIRKSKTCGEYSYYRVCR